jgi:hypothetical protein
MPFIRVSALVDPSPDHPSDSSRWLDYAARGLWRPALYRSDARREDAFDLRLPIALAFLVTLGSYGLAYLGVVLLSDRVPENLFGMWLRWDAVHYIQIARDGYGTDPESRFLIVWPPLYSWLVRAFDVFVGDIHRAGLLVSFVSFAGASALLYRLVALDFPERVAMRTVLYTAIFPTAYFLHAAYSEALFLLLVLGSFYAARRERWALAGVLGGLATFTRITGFGLIPALAVEYLIQKRFRPTEIRPNVLYIGLVPLGFAVYMLVNYVVKGDPLAFLEIAQDRHFKYLAPPWVGIERVWATAMGAQPRGQWIIVVFEIGLGLAALVVAVVAAFRLRLSYGVFVVLAWANFGFNSWWISTARYLIVLFPAFIVLALWGERRIVHASICFAFLTTYTILMLVYVQGPWTF